MSGENNFSVVFGNKTDVGKIRQLNEDYLECFKSSFGEVFVVCDGMGGHEGGEIASRLAVTTIKQVITSNPNNLSSPSAIIEESISVANRAIISQAEESPVLKGMGTTCVVLLIRENEAFYGHVGDSRLYLVRGNNLYLMTRDHSFVQGLVDQGLISREDAEKHPRKNEITQALGIFEKIRPEVNHQPLKLYKGDKFMLCSDGLSGPVQEDVILNIVSKHHPVEASNMLIDAANNSGGADNITVQVIEIINAELIPDAAIAPVGAILLNPPGKLDLSKTREFSYEASSSRRNTAKKRNIVPYLAVLAGVLIIATFAIWNPFGDGNGQRPKSLTNDTNAVNDQSNIPDSHKAVIKDVESNIKDLYSGKKIPDDFQFRTNVELSDSLTYKGRMGVSTRPYKRSQLVSNIKKHDLRFSKISDLKVSTNGYSCKIEVVEDNMISEYRMSFTISGKKAEIQEIIWEKSIENTAIDIDKNDKNSPNKNLQKKQDSEPKIENNKRETQEANPKEEKNEFEQDNDSI